MFMGSAVEFQRKLIISQNLNLSFLLVVEKVGVKIMLLFLLQLARLDVLNTFIQINVF